METNSVRSHREKVPISALHSHGRAKRSQCKECGGGGICVHERRRSVCKECGGGAICVHERIRSQCKECQLILVVCEPCQDDAGA